MKEEGLSGVNKPKRTPKHPTKSHAVMASEGGKYKFIRFGQQGVKGAGKNPKTKKDKARKSRTMHGTMRKVNRPQSYQLNIGRIKLSGNENGKEK